MGAAERTNSPISIIVAITTLDSTSNSLASSYTRTFASAASAPARLVGLAVGAPAGHAAVPGRRPARRRGRADSQRGLQLRCSRLFLLLAAPQRPLPDSLPRYAACFSDLAVAGSQLQRFVRGDVDPLLNDLAHAGIYTQHPQAPSPQFAIAFQGVPWICEQAGPASTCWRSTTPSHAAARTLDHGISLDKVSSRQRQYKLSLLMPS